MPEPSGDDRTSGKKVTASDLDAYMKQRSATGTGTEAVARRAVPPLAKK